MSEQKNTWHARRHTSWDGSEEWVEVYPSSWWTPREAAEDYAETLWHAESPDAADRYDVEVRDHQGNVTRWAVEVRAVPEFTARPA